MGESSYPNGEVELWLAGNSGRDQATSIKSLADNYFSVQSGIRLNIRLVDMDVLLRAVSANEGPDVAIFQDQATPINYALRSALQDLSVFEDVEEVKQRFGKSALTPLTLGDSLYGLPEQQTFLMMFYRKDILANLGLSVPGNLAGFLHADTGSAKQQSENRAAQSGFHHLRRYRHSAEHPVQCVAVSERFGDFQSRRQPLYAGHPGGHRRFYAMDRTIHKIQTG